MHKNGQSENQRSFCNISEYSKVNECERESTSVPVVISRSFGSRVRHGKTGRGERNVCDSVGPRRKAFGRFEGLCQRKCPCR